MMLRRRFRGVQTGWTRSNIFRQSQRGKARQPVRPDVVARAGMGQGRRQVQPDRLVSWFLKWLG